MPPVVFTFDGVKVYIYTEDHLPIHIHAKYAEFESIYELHFDAGKLSYVDVREGNFEPLPPQAHKKVMKFLKKYYKEVVEKWQQIVVFKKSKVSLTRISGL
jgi:hypothetical protein